MKRTILISLGLLLGLAWPASAALAQCRDNVVLVHGNSGSPGDFDDTRGELLARGYSAAQIFAPAWGNPSSPACNDHNGSEEVPVANAIVDAIATSCSGRIDVIGHSMGATLAAHEIASLGAGDYVDAFVGIAGAFRGLHSCGVWPYNVWTSTCGSHGLSIQSPLLASLYGQRFGDRMYSIKSWYDQITCWGGCLVGGVHTSSIPGEDASFTYTWGHFGLLEYTSAQQVNLLD